MRLNVRLERRPQRRSWRTLPAVALVAALIVIGLGALPAAAGTGSVQATISVGSSVLSLTVSPSSFSYCSSQSPLSFPNGQCSASSDVTVTMGNVGGHVEVNGADAVPSAGVGTHWTLCGGTSGAPACTGTSNGPGTDEYAETELVGNQVFTNGFLANAPSCDIAFSGSQCPAAAGESHSESFAIIGPAASTSTASSFSTSITWTASP
jgi:hypothetical protein